MFNTWQSIVREFNKQQDVIGQPHFRGCCKDGTFSWSWVMQKCKELGLDTVTSGSAEGKLPEPADCESGGQQRNGSGPGSSRGDDIMEEHLSKEA